MLFDKRTLCRSAEVYVLSKETTNLIRETIHLRSHSATTFLSTFIIAWTSDIDKSVMIMSHRLSTAPIMLLPINNGCWFPKFDSWYYNNISWYYGKDYQHVNKPLQINWPIFSLMALSSTSSSPAITTPDCILLLFEKLKVPKSLSFDNQITPLLYGSRFGYK